MEKKKKIIALSVISFCVLLVIAGIVIFAIYINKEAAERNLTEKTPAVEEIREIEEEISEASEPEEPDYSDTELYGEPSIMSDIYESPTLTSFNDDILLSETELPETAVWTLPYQLDEFLTEEHSDYNFFPGYFEYIDDSFWEKDDHSMMFIRIQSEDYPGIYIDCGYYEDSEHWAFSERNIEDLPSNHHRYKYTDDISEKEIFSPATVYDTEDEITVTEQ